MILHQKRVVVIGGSAGIGLATAIEAAKQGASIVIAGRSAEKLEQAKKVIPAESVETFQLNNQKEEEVQAFFEKVGAFDHLFTPGASCTRGPITIDTEKAKTPFEGNFGRNILLPSMRYRIFPRKARSSSCPGPSANDRWALALHTGRLTEQSKAWARRWR